VDPKSEIQNLLRKGKQVWADSKEEAKTLGRGANVPDGTYEVDLQSVEFKVKDGTPYLVRRHVVVDGEQKDKVLVDTLWYDLENARRTAFIFAYIEMLGFTAPEDPAELFDIVEQVNKEGYAAKARVYHWGDNDRMGVDLLEVYEPEAAAGAEGAAPAAAAEPAEKALEDMTVEELKEICTTEGIAVPSGRRGAAPSKDVLIAAIKAWDAAHPVEGEAAAPAADDAAALLTDTAAFCKAQDIAVTPAQAKDIEAMKKLISKYEYVRTELEESDASLLKDLGLEELIVEPAAPTPPPTPAPARRRGK
jgi:hypothetical protein